MTMTRVISLEDAKKVINLLRQGQPRTRNYFKEALGTRGFDVDRVLRGLEESGVLIRESLSGQEKFWLNENQAISFLGRDPRQRRKLKHPRGEKLENKPGQDDMAYG